MVVPNNHGFSMVFLLKIIILGCFGGTTILGFYHIYLHLFELFNGKSIGK